MRLNSITQTQGESFHAQPGRFEFMEFPNPGESNAEIASAFCEGISGIQPFRFRIRLRYVLQPLYPHVGDFDRDARCPAGHEDGWLPFKPAVTVGIRGPIRYEMLVAFDFVVESLLHPKPPGRAVGASKAPLLRFHHPPRHRLTTVENRADHLCGHKNAALSCLGGRHNCTHRFLSLANRLWTSTSSTVTSSRAFRTASRSVAKNSWGGPEHE